MIDVFALGGTGYGSGGDGVTETFLAGLDKSRFRVQFVAYPAEGFGLGMAYETSRDAGVQALIRKTESSPRFAVVGYSQGAVAAGDFAERYIDLAQNGGRIDHDAIDRLRGVGLIADGRRPGHVGTPGHPIAPGYGILGQRHLTNAFCPVLYAAAPGDPICALPAGNPLRTIADMVRWLSLRTGADVIQWGAQLLDAANHRGFQHWWQLKYWQDWDDAGDFARGFLFDGRHTDDYVRFGHCRALADAFNAQVTA